MGMPADTPACHAVRPMINGKLPRFVNASCREKRVLGGYLHYSSTRGSDDASHCGLSHRGRKRSRRRRTDRDSRSRRICRVGGGAGIHRLPGSQVDRNVEREQTGDDGELRLRRGPAVALRSRVALLRRREHRHELLHCPLRLSRDHHRHDDRDLARRGRAVGQGRGRVDAE